MRQQHGAFVLAMVVPYSASRIRRNARSLPLEKKPISMVAVVFLQFLCLLFYLWLINLL